MAITPGESAIAIQTFGNTYEVAFEAPTHGLPADVIKVTCITEGMTGRINDTHEFDIQPGVANPEYLRAVSPGGINKLELKRSGGTNATGYWNARVAV